MAARPWKHQIPDREIQVRSSQVTLTVLVAIAMSTFPASGQGDPLTTQLPSPLRAAAPGLDGIRELTFDAPRLERISSVLEREGRVDLIGMPLPDGREVTLVVRPIDPFVDGCRIELMTSTGIRLLPIPEMTIMAGEVRGEEGSDAFLAFTGAGVEGWIRSGGVPYFVSDGGEGGAPMISRMDLYPQPDEKDFCGVDHIAQPVFDPDPFEEPSGTEGGLAGEDGEPLPCQRVRLAIETDVELRDLFGGTDAGAIGYVSTMVAAASHVYTRDVNTRLVISYLRLWATEDPWTQPAMGDQLYEFRDHWEAQMEDIDRDLAHFLSGRGLGGGVAWLSVVCNPDWGYALSANLGSNFPYPLENNNGNNWDLMVFMHELGHNFGAPHTHSLTPPYDDCAGGDCSIVPNATIMSYCHGCEGGLANIRLEFCPPNITNMTTHLAETDCDLGVTDETLCLDDAIETDRNTTVIIDVIQNDVWSNCQLATLVDFDTSSVEGGSIELVPDWGPDGTPALRYTTPADFLGFDSFTYTSEMFSPTQNIQDTCTVVIDIEAEDPRRPADDPIDAEPGIEVAYYALEQLSQLPDFDTLEAFDSEVVPNIDYPSTGEAFMGSGLSDDVGAVFTGWVHATEAGEWRFGTNSDDGSALYIGDQRVVDNDGLHGMVERSGTIALEAGWHAIRVEFFERGGGAGLIVLAGGPETPYDVIPASGWMHGGTLPPDSDLDGNGTVDGADLTILLSQWGVQSGSADLDGNGIVDGSDLAILLGDWTTG